MKIEYKLIFLSKNYTGFYQSLDAGNIRFFMLNLKNRFIWKCKNIFENVKSIIKSFKCSKIKDVNFSQNERVIIYQKRL